MQCRVMLLLCVLLAGQARAGGITSFEPDTTARVARDREPMVDTPIWLGTSWTAGSEYQEHANGLTHGPTHFTGFGFGATWPWRSRLQGYAEWHYGVRSIQYSQPGTYYDGVNYVPYTATYVAAPTMFAVRGGTEYRFGRRSAPWCTAGGGVGYAFGDNEDLSAAFELTARTTFFTYPTRNARLGLMFSAGPTWFTSEHTYSVFSGSGFPGGPLRTHFGIALRFERRLRFPVANAQADEAD